MKKWYSIALIFVLCSCERQLNIDLPLLEEKLVVNAFANPEERMLLNMSTNTDLLGNPSIRSLDQEFKLLLLEDEQLVLDKTYQSTDGYIQTDATPKRGSSYEWIIEGEGFDVITSKDQMPDQDPVFEVLNFYPIGNQTHLDLLMFDHSETEYYMLEMYLHSFDIEGSDTVWYSRPLDFSSSDKIFFSNINTIRANTHFALFDDQLLSGSDREIRIVIQQDALESRSGFEVSHFSVVLKSLSKTYFDYYIGLLENNHIYGGPLASSNISGGNIEGGLGIFGCYTYKQDTVNLQ